MKKIILYALCVVCVQSFAQQKITQSTVKIADNSFSSFNFSDVEFSENGVTIYGRLWRMGTLSVTKDGKKSDTRSGNNMVPSALAVNINNNVVRASQEYINLQSVPWLVMKGFDYKAVDPRTSEQFASSNDKSWEELQLKYPKAFPSAKEQTETFYNYTMQPGISSATIRESSTQYKFDPVRNKLVGEKTQHTIITPKMPEFDGKYFFEPFFFKDNKRKMIACTAGMHKKGESKFYWMQNRKVATVGSNGDLIASFDVQFTYPRALMFAAPLGMSVTDTLSTFEDGGIFIFGRVFGGGKNNDPDPTNYEYVIVGSQGELKSKGVFKFGAEKRDLAPVYAYKKDDKIFLLSKGVGKDQPGYAVLTFDNTGLIQTKEYPFAQLKALTFGPYDRGITTNYGRLLQVTNHINLKDGGVLLCGEAFEDETPAGASFTDPKIRLYYSQVFLHLDRDGNLLKNMVLEKTEADSKNGYTIQRLLQENNNKFSFVSEERIGPNNFPVLEVVDLNAGTAKKISLKLDNLYNIDGDIIYRHFPEKSQVLFIGRNTDKDTYTLNYSVYSLE